MAYLCAMSHNKPRRNPDKAMKGGALPHHPSKSLANKKE
jgi:hypothetical protein